MSLRSTLGFFPFNPEKEKIIIKETEASGFEVKKIIILESALTKERHIREFVENLSENLSEEEKSRILLQKESRLDKILDFFLRFDKDEAINHNKLVLTDGGNCFHIRMSIAAFPKRREKALEIVNLIFKLR